jgi:hypothetical protein
LDPNPYAAPSLDVDSQIAHGTTEATPWFAVGTRKLTVMSLVTMGLYGVYWFERQYRYQKRLRGEDSWPVARAIFSVFFANDLFKRVESAARGTGLNPPWTGKEMATIFVVAAIVGRVFDKVGEKIEGPAGGALGALSLLAVLGLVYPIVKVQGTINELLTRDGRPFDSNEGFTAWNWIVLALGGIVIVLASLSFVLPSD